MRAALFGFGLLALGACGASHPALVMPDQNTGIGVVGHGKVQVRPDVAIFRIGVEVRRPSVAEAREIAARAQGSVLDAIRAAGVQARDVHTGQLTIAPEYEYTQSGRRLLGYTVTNTVEVRVRALDRLQPAIDSAVAAGGDVVRLEGVTFDVDDPQEATAVARAHAIENARDQAEQIARALGVRLGEPIAVEEMSASRPSPIMMRMAQAEDAQASTPIEPGTNEVNVELRVRWAIASR